MSTTGDGCNVVTFPGGRRPPFAPLDLPFDCERWESNTQALQLSLGILRQDRSKTEDFCRALGRPEVVNFAGWLEEVADHLIAAADLMGSARARILLAAAELNEDA